MNARHRQSGLSLIELMIALTIGLVLLGGLTYLFVNSSNSQRVGQAAAQANESARYAMDTLTTDLHHAGYYGQYGAYADGTTAPDPCSTTPAVSDLGFPIQGFVAVIASGSTLVPSNQYPDLSATSCGTALLPQANLMPGSDILVIRRVDTTPLAVGATAVSNQLYLQSNPLGVAFQTGNGSAMTSTSGADGSTATLTVYDTATATNVAGPISQYYVDIYFVAPCSVPAGGGTVCTGSTDDNGSPIPTLKMLQLNLSGGAMAFTSYTIAEGIQAMKLEFGIDTQPTAASSVTGRIGDGQADCYEPNSATSQPAATDYPSAAAVKVFMISRGITTTKNFTDTKNYEVSSPSSFSFGSCTANGLAVKYGQYNDSYMRHGYESDIRLTNMASRREIP
jgi:type IV pilus assembly protein PilW